MKLFLYSGWFRLWKAAKGSGDEELAIRAGIKARAALERLSNEELATLWHARS